MKKTDKGNFAFSFLRSLARVIDDPDGWIELFHKNVSVCVIQPQTKDYWKRKDILREYQWEEFPYGYSDVCCLWLGDVCLTFDEFVEGHR